MRIGFLTAATILMSLCHAAQAHVGSPNVIFDGKAGEYPVRVVIRPPQVVPGLAEISVRAQVEGVARVTVLPIFWNAGRNGAPPPDEARLVPGETNLYAAALWLMKPGAYSVEVSLAGARGKGSLILPVNSIATNTRPMGPTHRAILTVLGLVLFLGGMKIAGAIAGESRLEPAALPTQKDRWRGRAAMVLAAIILGLLVWGGKAWWDYEDLSYRNNSLYKPFPVSTEVVSQGDENLLRISVDATQQRGRWTPLMPDHGKIMHLFLIGASEPRAFAHLHPVQKETTVFDATLPPLPAGSYHLYADITHENGFAETLVSSVKIPQASPAMKRLWLGNSSEPICSVKVAQTLAANLSFPPDPDDSWYVGNDRSATSVSVNGSEEIAQLSGGYQIVRENLGPIRARRDTSLRFRLIAPTNEPASIEPYMGMAGHAVVWRLDGGVFAHIHPVGTFSMAAQEFFVNGKPKDSGSNGRGDALATLHTNHVEAVSSNTEITFPCEFPSVGTYRIWVQMKSHGRILTGEFPATIGGG